MSCYKIEKTSAQTPRKIWWWQRGFAGLKQMKASADMNQLDNAGGSCLHSVQQCGLCCALVLVVLG